MAGRRIAWTETARLQLVEAVIKAENEMLEDSKRATGAGKLEKIAREGDINWTRVANLLPAELRGKVWCSRRQRFICYKCKLVFLHLVSAYRDKLAGKITCYSRIAMTEPVCEIIKRREDILKARTSTRAESSLKSGFPDRVSSGTRAARPQRLHKQETSNRGVTSRNTIRWTETARILLIKAVIQVEEEDARSKGRKRSVKSSSTRRVTGKWERVANLLPRMLQGRTWNNEQQTSAGYKCRYCFLGLLRAYRTSTGAMSSAEGQHLLQLTEPVYKAMTNREDLLTAQVDRSFGKRRTSDRFHTSTRSRKEEEHLSPTHRSPLNVHTDQEHSSQERSVGTEAQPAATLSSQQYSNESERNNDTSMNHTGSTGENLHADMEGLLRRIDPQFSRLSSWVESQLTRFKTRVMQEITSSKIHHNRSGGRRATEPFANERNFRRMIDYQILASFEKLRFKFTGELKNASDELSQQVLQAYPYLSHGVGEWQCPFKKSRRR